MRVFIDLKKNTLNIVEVPQQFVSDIQFFSEKKRKCKRNECLERIVRGRTTLVYS